MALTFGDREIRPLTTDDVSRMLEAGILREGDPVELLHGVLTEVTQQAPPHALVIQRLTAWLAPLMVAGTHGVRVQLPLVVPDRTSLPEPDLAVVEPDPPPASHPAAAALVVEVAHKSRYIDTKVKAPLYAEAGVPEYWIVDLLRGHVQRFTNPSGGEYTDRSEVVAPQTLRAEGLDLAPLAVADLLDGM
jgi:Uma2 family endonuclease